MPTLSESNILFTKETTRYKVALSLTISRRLILTWTDKKTGNMSDINLSPPPALITNPLSIFKSEAGHVGFT